MYDVRDLTRYRIAVFERNFLVSQLIKGFKKGKPYFLSKTKKICIAMLIPSGRKTVTCKFDTECASITKRKC